MVMCCLAAGCEAVVLVTPEGPLTNKQIYAQYQQTTLKQSTSADVLSRFGTPKDTLVEPEQKHSGPCGDY